jgi:leader peptidase (prepilin peptidase)/N-methyltransferase
MQFFLASDFFVFYIFLIGASIGSFINVVVFRLPLIIEGEWHLDIREYLKSKGIKHNLNKQLPLNERFKSLNGKSSCPKCNVRISWYYNIPIIGLLALKGKSKCCNIKISLRYPAIEILYAVFYTLTVSLLSIEQALPIIVMFSLLVPMALIDHDKMIIPDNLVYILLWSGFIMNDFIPHGLDKMIIAALIGYLSIYFINFFSEIIIGKTIFGHGDAKLLAAIGIWTGPLGLAYIMTLSPIVALFYRAIAFKEKIPVVPFGPALAITGIIIFIKYISYGNIL